VRALSSLLGSIYNSCGVQTTLIIDTEDSRFDHSEFEIYVLDPSDIEDDSLFAQLEYNNRMVGLFCANVLAIEKEIGVRDLLVNFKGLT